MPGFAEEACPYYVQALRDADYWLSVDELVLICQLARAPVIVFKQGGAVLEAAESSPAGSGTAMFVKIATERDGPVRSHFERMLSTHTL